MYGTIPDVVISKPPRNNQFRVVAALGVGVLIGALGTAMLFPVTTKETEHPTPAPRPILAMDGPEIEMSEDLQECRKQMGSCYAQLQACASTSRPVTSDSPPASPRWNSTLNPTAAARMKYGSVRNGSPRSVKYISPRSAP